VESLQPDTSGRIVQAAALLRAEANELEARFNRSYPKMVQSGSITPLGRPRQEMYARVQQLRALADQIDSL